MHTSAAPLPTVLQTERLVLRRPRRDDASAWSALEGDPLLARHRLGGPLSRSASDADLEQNLADWTEDGPGYRVVEWHGEVAGRRDRPTPPWRSPRPTTSRRNGWARRLGMTFHRQVPVPGLPDSVEFRRPVPQA